MGSGFPLVYLGSEVALAGAVWDSEPPACGFGISAALPPTELHPLGRGCGIGRNGGLVQTVKPRGLSRLAHWSVQGRFRRGGRCVRSRGRRSGRAGPGSDLAVPRGWRSASRWPSAAGGRDAGPGWARGWTAAATAAAQRVAGWRGAAPRSGARRPVRSAGASRRAVAMSSSMGGRADDAARAPDLGDAGQGGEGQP